MKASALTLEIFFLSLVFLEAGCESAPKTVGPSFDASICADYMPVKVDIIPLTEFVSGGNEHEATKISVYVSLLDSFDSQKKAPGVFRFELYEKAVRSPEPKGKRVVIWPDIDLTDAVENDNYWRDFLRTYEFSLDFEPQRNRSYILQVTYLCPSGKRLSDEFKL